MLRLAEEKKMMHRALEAHFLKEMPDLAKLKVTKTRQGELNLFDEELNSYFHSNYSAQKEAEAFVGNLKLKTPSLLYIYGIGMAHSYRALLPWLKSDPGNYLIYLEDDPRVIKELLLQDSVRDLFLDKQVVVAPLESKTGEELDDLAYQFIHMPFQIQALEHYERKKNDRFKEIQLKIMHASAYTNFVGMEFLGHGASFFQNFYQNVLHMGESHSAAHLFGQFQGIPAIIVGAGPSLNRNLNLLKTLKERAVIFAGGSGINALTSQGMLPHFGASVDPNAEQYKRMSRQSGHEVPFFYKTRVHHRSFLSLHGPRLYLSGNTGYPISDWIDRELGSGGQRVTEGHNVLHMLIDVAHKMGCNPIIFVGMDLAFSELSSYASGVVDKPNVSQAEITKQTHLNDNAFLRPGFDGKPVYTLWKWVAEARYTANYAKEHPETTFINATEGGLGIEGIANSSLADVAKAHLNKTYELESRIFKEIERARFSIPQDKIFDTFLKLQESLTSSIGILGELIDCLKALSHSISNEMREHVSDVLKQITSLLQKLADEVAHEEILKPVGHIRSVLMNREFETIEREEASAKDSLLKYASSNITEYTFLKECAEVNLAFLKEALEKYLSKEELQALYTLYPKQ
ncbi:MAG: hypothetical protein K0S07_552 [Chlamydiales bacterium]|jgi:hypothetical protein|nr:hypothetical protein [Chlamydiales bacterium]